MANGCISECNQGVLSIRLKVNIDRLEEEALKVLQHVRPSWKSQNVEFKYFTDGITNKLIGCYLKDSGMKDVVLIRVNGEGTDMIIDREAEIQTFQLLKTAGCAPPLYALFCNGMAYGYVPGRPLNEQIVRDEKISMLIAQEMVCLHNIKPDKLDPCQRFSQYPAKLQSFFDIIPTRFSDPEMQSRFQQYVPNRPALQAELNEICQQLESMQMPVVFSHNDLLLKNIIYDDESDPAAVHFIDFEYAFLNYQAYDIGNHFCEYAGVDEVNYDLYPEKGYQLKWLHQYLQFDFIAKGKSPSAITTTDVERLYVQTNKCSCAAHFFWSLWALIQAKNSSIDFDFLGYSIIRLTEYFRRKKEFFPLSLV